MNRKWPLLKVLAAVCSVVMLTSAAEAAKKKVGKYTWYYTKVGGGVRIVNGGKCAVSPKPKGALKIPKKIGKFTVKAIGANAFTNCVGLTSVTVPSTVTSIGSKAFYDCKKLTKVTLSKKLTSMDSYAFGNCIRLGKVSIPEKVEVIKEGAFYDCKNLAKVTLSVNVTGIGAYAFSGCGELTEVLASMGTRLKSIGGSAFENCRKLEKVSLPPSLESIGADAFASTSLKTIRYELADDDERIYDMLVASGLSEDVVRAIDYQQWCHLTLTPNKTGYGSVNKSGWYRAGYDPVVITATPKSSDYVFAGWYWDKACTKPLENTEDENIFYDVENEYRQKKVSIDMPRSNTTIYAKFIKKKDDKKTLKFSAATQKLAKTATNANAGECVDLQIEASSASLPTFSAKGLPMGLAIDARTGKITGTPTRPGSFTATVTVKSAAGYKITQKVKFNVYVDASALGWFEGIAQPSAKAADPMANLIFAIGSTGQVSGKVVYKDSSYSFTAQCSYSEPGITKFTPSIKIGTSTFKPGEVTVMEQDMEGVPVTFASVEGTQAFCAFHKADLITEGGGLESFVNETVTLTEEDDVTDLEKGTVTLNVLFKGDDLVTIVATINGKQATISPQISLKQANWNGSEWVYDMVVPVILYRYGYYRSLWFHFSRDPAGKVELIESAIREIGDIL